MARLAVAILNYNGAGFLKQFLPAIIAHTPEADIIVGDNGSTDHSRQLLADEFPSVQVEDLGGNHGYAGGYNRLLDRLDYEYVALVNSDIEVTAGWLQPLVDILDKDNRIVAVQPKILDYRHKNQFEYAGAGGGFIDRYGYPFCRGRIFNTLEEDRGQYNDIRPVFWASGACFVVRMAAFKEADGFDERFFAHMEEIDLCWRWQRSGKKIMYCGKSTVYHVGGGTLAYRNPRKTYLNFRNNWLTLIRNLPPGELIPRLPARIAMDWLSVLYFLFTGRFGSALAVFRAHLYLPVHPGLLRQLRQQSRLQASYEVAPYPKSLVWQYFVKGKKRFSDLIPD